MTPRWPDIVAIYNPRSKTVHDSSGNCGHISWNMVIGLKSWASEKGQLIRQEGHPCRSCVAMFDFTIPPLNEG